MTSSQRFRLIQPAPRFRCAAVMAASLQLQQQLHSGTSHLDLALIEAPRSRVEHEHIKVAEQSSLLISARAESRGRWD